MLTTAYVALAVIGCGYVLVSAFVGHLGNGGDGGHEHAAHGADAQYGIDGSGHGAVSAGAASAAEFHFPFFSPLALFTFMGALGAFGLIARVGAGLADWPSLAVAVPAAAATSYGATWLGWRLFTGATGSSEIRDADLAGAEGEVITPIPSGGLGEVAVMVRGQRFAAPAREAEGGELPRGTGVRVVRAMGSTLVVQRLAGGGGQSGGAMNA
jgi:membrane protein implicated in regulation of membrane protease activity